MRNGRTEERVTKEGRARLEEGGGKLLESKEGNKKSENEGMENYTY